MNRRPTIGISLNYNNTVLKEIETGEYEISIGRNPDNDIQVDNLAVSGEHAKIIRGMTDYYIEDLSSTNGTFVNGEENKNPTPEGPVLVTPRGGYFALAPGGGKDELSTN